MGANEKLGAAMHGATPHERAIEQIRLLADRWEREYEKNPDFPFEFGLHTAAEEVRDIINEQLGESS